MSSCTNPECGVLDDHRPSGPCRVMVSTKPYPDIDGWSGYPCPRFEPAEPKVVSRTTYGRVYNRRPVESADAFATAYAKRSGVTVEWLKQQGQEVRPCDCGDCEGWQMGRVEAQSPVEVCAACRLVEACPRLKQDRHDIAPEPCPDFEARPPAEEQEHLPDHLRGRCLSCGWTYDGNVEHNGKDSSSALGPIEKHDFIPGPCQCLRCKSVEPPVECEHLDIDLEGSGADIIGKCVDCGMEFAVLSATRLGDLTAWENIGPGLMTKLAETVRVPVAQWAEVTGLVGSFRERAEALSSGPITTVVKATILDCADELERATKGEVN